MLSTGCDYCISQLIMNKSNEYDPLPLPHLLLDISKMGFESFMSGASFHINHPLFCPQILISNQAKEKLKLANRELRRQDCPCQRESFRALLLKSTHDEIGKRCHDGKYAFKQNGDIIEELAKEYQSKLEENGIKVRKEKFLKDMKKEFHKIANGKKEESEEFQERLHDVLRTKMYDKQP